MTFPLSLRAGARPATTFLLGLAALAPIGCRKEPRPIEQPGTLAVVAGRPIVRDEFDRFVRERLGSAEADRASPEVLSALFDQLVEEEILVAKATGESKERPVDPAARRSAIERFLAKAAASAPPVGPADVEQWYAAHPERFALPERVRLRQILVRTEKEAREVEKRLAAGDPFEAVSKRWSVAPNADRGGAIGTISRGQLPPEFETAVFQLAPGRTTKAISAPSGWHVFLVEEKAVARTVPLDEVRETLREELDRERKEEASRRAIEAVRRGAAVELALDRFPFRYRGDFGGAPPPSPVGAQTTAGSAVSPANP